ncbi:MAG: hypothetical protein HXY34_09085 [Candidatus Thorarchaeota archaeon]|nr:hypothetical protein [Candidatus Thorarchaeota archaeon]
MSKKMRYDPELAKFVSRHNLSEKMRNIIATLGNDAQAVLDWAAGEARSLSGVGPGEKGGSLGKVMFELVAREASIRLVIANDAKGRITTRDEVKRKMGYRVEMPVLYHEAGIRHPQEARNLRHNIFHESFMALVNKLFPDVSTSIPTTGKGLTPDLIMTHKSPDWQMAVEYKAYRSLTLLSESEILKGMRYQTEWGTAWLITTSTKSVRDVYGNTLRSEELVDKGVERLRRIAKRRTYTNEQRENRGIAKKGIAHLEKHGGESLSCRLTQTPALVQSCVAGKPLRGLAISTGFEIVGLLRENGLEDAAEDMLKVMKLPTETLSGGKVTSVRLIGSDQ